MRFHGLDLNLLVALDVLLTEQNVSRAAEKLHLSQSATSGALARLREHFQDELLVPLGRKMVLTPRALELSGSVRDILLQVQSRVLTRPRFIPAETRRTFSLVASDYMTLTCIAGALRELAALAPGISFEISEPDESPSQMLDRGIVDFLVMPDFYLTQNHPSETLFQDTYRCLVWSNSAAFGETLSFDDYIAARHVIVRIGHGRVSRFDDWFQEQYGAVRNIELVAPHYTSLPFLIVGTDRLTVIHKRLADIFSALLPIRAIELPFDIPPIVEAIQWHSYSDNDAAVIWVKDQIKAAVVAAA